MKLRQAAIFCFSVFLLAQSCKKQEPALELFRVEEISDKIVVSNLTHDTAYMEFALIRISGAHQLSSGALNDGFALSSSLLPVTLLPGDNAEIQKQVFVFKSLDTLRNEDRLAAIGYNIRTFQENDSVGMVNRYSHTF